MGPRSKTSVATDYRAYADQQRAIAERLEVEGDAENAEHYRAAARHYEDKASRVAAAGGAQSVVIGEVSEENGRVIAWRPENTLKSPDQVAFDASAERKQLLLGPQIDVCALALDSAETIGAENSLEKMLAHQLALAHRLAFDFANRAAKQTDPIIATKLMNVSARMMDTYQHGLLAIQKLRSGNSQTVTVQHVHVSGGQTLVAGTMLSGGGQETVGVDKKK